MAERLFKARMASGSEWTAVSAGTSAVSGWPASQEAVTALKEKGIELSDHASQPVTRELLQKSDLIFTMTGRHKNDILTFDPSVADRIHLVTSFGTSQNNIEVPDPIGMSLDVYRHTRDVLESAIADIILHIIKHEKPDQAEQKGHHP